MEDMAIIGEEKTKKERTMIASMITASLLTVYLGLIK